MRTITVAALLMSAPLLSNQAQANTVVHLDSQKELGKVSPLHHGLMTEEINYSYDGGLYAELLRNRNFKDSATEASSWQTVATADTLSAELSLDRESPLNLANDVNLKVTVKGTAKEGALAGVSNSGFWGVPIKANTSYRLAVFLAAIDKDVKDVEARLVSEDGKTIYASKSLGAAGKAWARHDVVLSTDAVPQGTIGRLMIGVGEPAVFRIGFASLFPPTYNNRPNGLRPELMQMLVDLKPRFLRFPGGNYLEGNKEWERFDWKRTIGPIERRPGHQGPWGYRSSDGLGLLEFLEWAQDMGAEPVLAVYAGYNLNGSHVENPWMMDEYVKEALEEIEYVIGGTDTYWGAVRASNGHPEPFPLHYVEIGNEDWFDKSGSYQWRYAKLHDAIKAKYPQLKCISSIGNEHPADVRVSSRNPDVLDEHYYASTDEFIGMRSKFDSYDRKGPEIFVGEWAAHEDAKIRPWSPESRNFPPVPTFKAAIGDAVFLTAMERNSDLIRMQCYAPLLVNVNPGGRQWRPNLIGYNATSVFGSPSYHVIKLFSNHLGDTLVKAECDNTDFHVTATKVAASGKVFLKVTNAGVKTEKVVVKVNGELKDAKGTYLHAEPQALNSVEDPTSVVPQSLAVVRAGSDLEVTLPGQAIALLEIN